MKCEKIPSVITNMTKNTLISKAFYKKIFNKTNFVITSSSINFRDQKHMSFSILQIFLKAKKLKVVPETQLHIIDSEKTFSILRFGCS